jgi:hypothetical protein
MKIKTMKTKTMKTKTMKTKSILSLTCGLVLLCLGGQANAALTVINGDFSNLTGLAYEGGPWYSGIPSGWNTVFPETNYTVIYTGNPSPGVFTYAANLSQLSSSNPWAPLSQSVGTTDYTGDVTLKFDLSTLNPAASSWEVGVAIYSKNNEGDLSLLANRSIFNGFADPISGLPQNGIGTFELTASNVTSGSLLEIAFWNTTGTGGTPGLTNVSIIPEPSSYALMLGGTASLLLLRLLRRRVQS